jgi:hypothetical protein
LDTEEAREALRSFSGFPPSFAQNGFLSHPGATVIAGRNEGAVVEPLIVAVIGGVALAIVLAAGIWKIVSRAVDNGLDWLIHTFGNEQAAKRIEQKWRRGGECSWRS